MGGTDALSGVSPPAFPTPALPALPAPLAHQFPDVRHGPAQRVTAPPAKPAAIGRDAHGLASATTTRAGTGWRQRRSADIRG